MRNAAYIRKKQGSWIKVTYANGHWPWLKEMAGGQMVVTDGCSGTDSGYVALDPTDQVIMVFGGASFSPDGPLIAEISIGKE